MAPDIDHLRPVHLLVMSRDAIYCCGLPFYISDHGDVTQEREVPGRLRWARDVRLNVDAAYLERRGRVEWEDGTIYR